MVISCLGDDSELVIKTYDTDLPEAVTSEGASYDLSYKILNSWLNKSAFRYAVTTVENRYINKIRELEYQTVNSESLFAKTELELEKVLVDKDNNHPDVVFAGLDIKNNNSIYGSSSRIAVVDLGLPSGTKWGNCNLGCSVPSNQFKEFKSFLLSTKPNRPTLATLNNKPELDVANYLAQKSTSTDNSAGVVVTIPYKDYKKIMGNAITPDEMYELYANETSALALFATNLCEELYGEYIKRLEANKTLVLNYTQKFEDYVDAYIKAKQNYFYYLFNAKYAYMFQAGNSYQWGMGQADDNATTFPSNLDAATDVSTHLCTPTLEQIKELKNYCTLKDITYRDYADEWGRYISCRIAVGPNGNKIGLYKNGKYMVNYYDRGYYNFQVYGPTVLIDYTYFDNGFLVRPVYK